MTAERRDRGKLEDVKHMLRMVEQGIDEYADSLETAFSKWVRDNDALDAAAVGLSIQNIDWVVHRFKTPENGRSCQHIMLIEEKRNGASMNNAQNDTLRKLDALIRKDPVRLCDTARNQRCRMRYHGLHLLAFSGRGPEDSEQIHWDGKLITLLELEMLLRFEIDTRTLQPMREITQEA